MIRISKSQIVPESLTETQTYDGEDVQERLLHDQHRKCYLCERTRTTDFEIEHHKSKKNFPESQQDWENLLLVCGYCNKRKASLFDNIVNPTVCNVEEEITQRIDFNRKMALFSAIVTEESHQKTAELLNRLFNGKKGLRKIKEELFFEYTLSVINRFQKILNNYLMNPTTDNEQKVKDELQIDKEFLGFKYWIIRDNKFLYQIFHKDIIWNKQH